MTLAVSFVIYFLAKITDIHIPCTHHCLTSGWDWKTTVYTLHYVLHYNSWYFGTSLLLNLTNWASWVDPRSWVEPKGRKGLGFPGRLFDEGTSPFTNWSMSLPGTLLLWGELVSANFKDLSLSLSLRNLLPFVILCDKASNWEKISGTCKLFHVSHIGNSKPFTFWSPCTVPHKALQTLNSDIGVQVAVRVAQ